MGGGGEAVEVVSSTGLARGDEVGGALVGVVVSGDGGAAGAEVAVEGEPVGVIVDRGEVAGATSSAAAAMDAPTSALHGRSTLRTGIAPTPRGVDIDIAQNGPNVRTYVAHLTLDELKSHKRTKFELISHMRIRGQTAFKISSTFASDVRFSAK